MGLSCWLWAADRSDTVFGGFLTMQDGEEVMRNLEQTEEKRFGIYIGKAIREILAWDGLGYRKCGAIRWVWG